MLFTNTLPELIFRVLECQPERKSTILEPRAAPKWGFGTTAFAEETKRDRRGADLAEFWHRNRPKVWILDGFATIEGECSIKFVYLVAQSNSQSCKNNRFSASFFRFRISIAYPLELILGVVIQ